MWDIEDGRDVNGKYKRLRITGKNMKLSTGNKQRISCVSKWFMTKISTPALRKSMFCPEEVVELFMRRRLCK